MKKKEKRQLSEKQLANLAVGRARLKQNIIKKKLQPMLAEQIKPEQDEPKLVSPPASPAPPAALPKIRKLGGRLWWQVAIGMVFIILDVFVARMYMQDNTNAFLAALFIIVGGTGIFFLYLGLHKREEGILLKGPGQGKKKTYPANCLSIYYGYDTESKKYSCDSIKFEQLEPAQIKNNHPQQCLDDGKWYYVHIYDPLKKALIPFNLPDTQYYSPEEFCNPLNMPASRKELKPVVTLGEKLKPVLLVVAIGVLGLIMVMTNKPPGA